MTTIAALRRLLRQHPWAALLSVLAFGLIYGCALALAFLTRAIFDVVAGSDARGLPVLIGLLLAASLGRVVAFPALVFAQATAQHILGAILRHNLLAGLLSRPAARALVVPPGAAVNRCRDDPGAVMALVNPAGNTLALGLFSAAALAAMLAISVPVTLATLLPLAAVAVVGRYTGRRVGADHAATREAGGRVAAALTELFAAVATLKVAGAEGRVLATLAPLEAARRLTAWRSAIFAEVLNSIYGNLAALGTGVILFAAARGLRSGTFTVGDFAFFVFVLDYTAGLAGSAGILIGRYRAAGVALDRLAALLPGMPAGQLVAAVPVPLRRPPGLTPQPRQAADPPLEVLTVTNLAYQYPESGRGVADVSLRLARGSFTVVTGRVGAGKTTLLLALLGLLPRDGGEIHWNGTPVDDAAAFFIPPRCAYTPQVPRLFSDTLRDNILLGLDVTGEELAAAVRVAALDRDVAAFAQGLDTLVGSRGVRLSGGQIQRAAAARMAVRRPELLVCDDLSSALDAATERTLWDRLAAREGATYLVVSHRRAVLRRATQIVVLKNGAVEDIGTLPDLLARCDEFRAIWARQPGGEEQES